MFVECVNNVCRMCKYSKMGKNFLDASFFYKVLSIGIPKMFDT